MPVLLNFLDRIRTRGSNVGLAEPSWRSYARWGEYNEDEALRFSAVYAAVSLIADAIASLPPHVYRAKRDGSAETVTSEAYAYLHTQANPEVPNFTFWQTVMGHKVLNGNAYIFVQKRADGLPLALWPIEPSRVMVGREPDGQRRKVYRIDNNDPMIDYSAGGEIVHIMSMSRDGVIGLSPIRQAAHVLGLAGAARDWSHALFGSGGKPGSVLSTPEKLSPAEASETGQYWDSLPQGRTAVLSGGATWQQTTLSPVDAQLLDFLKWGVSDVARWFRVPPHLIGDVERSTSWGTGIAEQNQNFLTYTLAPHLIPAEQAVSSSLLGGGSVYMRFNTGGLLRGSTKERYEAYSIALGKQPFATQDQIRAFEEWPAMGGEAAELGVGVGATNVGGSGEPAEEEPQAASAPTALRTYCPDCNRALGRDIRGTVWCRHCKAEKTFA